MWSLQQKQKYIRQHIPQKQYVEFWEYIEDTVGNFDLENWTQQFLIQLIEQYTISKNTHNQHQTSFFQYQSDERNQKLQTNKKANNILPPISQTQFKTNKTNLQTTVKNTHNAVTLLDQILIEAKGTTKSNPNMNISNKSSPSLQKIQTPSASVFASNQFWQVGSLYSTEPRQKATKPTVDFASFDFWSQPSSANSSPQNFKSVNYSNYFDKEKQLDKTAKNLASIVPQQIKNIPSFDQLLMNYQTQKGPSPYLKKNAVEESLSDKVVERPVSKSNESQSVNTKKIPQKTVQKPFQKVEKPKPVQKPDKVLYDGEIILKQEFEDTIKCFPSTERVRLSSPGLRVAIEGHQIVQRTFLFPDYVMYDVKVIPLNITCKRNYQDFSRLRQTLSKLFPGTKLAYLQKNAWFSSTSLQFVKKQKVMLQYFLNDLIRNTEIRNSRILEDFLTLPEHKKIKRKFQEWQKLQPPKGIEELCLLGGKLEVSLSQQQRLYQDNFTRYHSKLIDFLQKQQKLTETLVEQYQQIENTQKALKSLVNAMIEETKYFNQRVYGLEFNKIHSAFTCLSKQYNFEEEHTKFTIDLLKNKFIAFLGYEKENTAEFSELIDIQQSFFKSYLKRSAVEKPEEGTPYTSDKIKQFKVSVLQQSKNILVLKYQSAYLSNQTCQESNRLVQSLGEKYLSLMRQYSAQSEEQGKKLNEFWRSFNKNN